MKKYFLTGLIILIPTTLTLAIVQFLINLLTAPFLGIVDIILSQTLWFGKLSSRELAEPISKLLILLFLVVLIISIGFLARIFIINYILHSIDLMIHRIPWINKIYQTFKETVHALFKPSKSEFSRVALVPFTRSGSYCIGFITKDELDADQSPEPSHQITVFVPGAPNPTAGYMLLFERSQLIYLDMKVEDAVKYLLSCGVIPTEFKSQLAAYSEGENR